MLAFKAMSNLFFSILSRATENEQKRSEKHIGTDCAGCMGINISLLRENIGYREAGLEHSNALTTVNAHMCTESHERAFDVARWEHMAQDRPHYIARQFCISVAILRRIELFVKDALFACSKHPLERREKKPSAPKAVHRLVSMGFSVL